MRTNAPYEHGPSTRRSGAGGAAGIPVGARTTGRRREFRGAINAARCTRDVLRSADKRLARVHNSAVDEDFAVMKSS
jgi:hypothetical protein